MAEEDISGGQFALIYASWIVAMVLGFLALVSGRELVLTLLAVGQVDLKLVALIDKVVFFLMGAIGLTIIVLSEGYFRTGARRGQLVARIGLVFGLELLGLFFCDAARLLIPGVIKAARPGMGQTVMSLAIGGLCLGVFWKKR